MAAAAKKKAALQKLATDSIDLLKDAVPEFNEFVSQLGADDDYQKQVCNLLLDRAKEMMRMATGFALDPTTEFQGDIKQVRQAFQKWQRGRGRAIVVRV